MAWSEEKFVKILLQLKEIAERQDNNNKLFQSDIKSLFEMIKALEERVLLLELERDVKGIN